MKKIVQSVVLLGVIGAGLFAAAPGAWASHGGPGKNEQSTSGFGTLKTPWTLKAALDDSLVGEEFEIKTSANTPPNEIGQVWEVQFFKNGQPFLDQEVPSTATGVRVAQMTPQLPLPLKMSVHAHNATTGEDIDGFVTLT